MGGIYGKLTITAFILFVAIQIGFIIMCAAFGRRNKIELASIQIEERLRN